jgi:hypothetical protein
MTAWQCAECSHAVISFAAHIDREEGEKEMDDMTVKGTYLVVRDGQGEEIESTLLGITLILDEQEYYLTATELEEERQKPMRVSKEPLVTRIL